MIQSYEIFNNVEDTMIDKMNATFKGEVHNQLLARLVLTDDILVTYLEVDENGNTKYGVHIDKVLEKMAKMISKDESNGGLYVISNNMQSIKKQVINGIDVGPILNAPIKLNNVEAIKNEDGELVISVDVDFIKPGEDTL